MAHKVDLLKDAVTAQRKIPDRAEMQTIDDHRRLFVDNTRQNFAGAMAGTGSQIVFGRRGTGKTMLLNKLFRDGQPFNQEAEYIAIMVQVPDFLRSPETTEKDPPVVQARAYFREFLYQVSTELLRVHDNILRNEDFLARLGLRNKTKRLIIGDRFMQLSQILTYGVRTYRIGSAAFEEHAEDSEQSQMESGSGAKLSLGGELDAKVGRPTAAIGIRSELSMQSSSEHSQSRKVHRKEDFLGEYDIGIPEIREKLQDILDMIRVRQVMILLDEWQALRLDCQSEFAHLLNRCFFGIECVSVKIAAYQHVCHFNNGGIRGQFRGLELGQDIEVVGDTDLPPADDNTKKFFFDILYRRLLFMKPDLEKHYGPPEVFDHATLVGDIFQNQHAADMLVRGCHGVSRDFIKAFNRAADQSKDDVARQKITLDAVNRAHEASSRGVQSNIGTSDDIGGLLFEIIKPHVNRTGRPYFFLPETDHQWDSLLWELVEKLAIHSIPEASMPIGTSVNWKGFEVSYGLFQMWCLADAYTLRASPTASRMQWVDAAQLPSEEFQSHVLQVKGEPGSARTCAACQEQFSTTCHSFIVAKRCPHCYAKQDDPGGIP